MMASASGRSFTWRGPPSCSRSTCQASCSESSARELQHPRPRRSATITSLLCERSRWLPACRQRRPLRASGCNHSARAPSPAAPAVAASLADLDARPQEVRGSTTERAKVGARTVLNTSGGCPICSSRCAFRTSPRSSWRACTTSPSLFRRQACCSRSWARSTLPARRSDLWDRQFCAAGSSLRWVGVARSSRRMLCKKQ
mmetsp:Transcript_78194/g.217140  ORF Transcript_78194/g.217140 Transcript_78194/m.217140 type:complete len:200 (+) Transcript_78194:514-1113(+)